MSTCARRSPMSPAGTSSSNVACAMARCSASSRTLWTRSGWRPGCAGWVGIARFAATAATGFAVRRVRRCSVLTCASIGRAALAYIAVPGGSDTRLVADLHLRGDVGEGMLRRPDHRVLGLPGQVGGVEVEQVVVLDAMARGPAGDWVPDGLEQ